MDTPLTIKELLIFLLGAGGVVLIVFLCVAVRHLISTLKSASIILKDFETISKAAAKRTEQVDGIIDDVAKSVGSVTKGMSNNQGFLRTLSAIANLVTTLKGVWTKKEKTSDTDKKKGA